MKTSNRFSVKISAIAASIMLANAAIGQEGGSGVEGLEEIIVTVQKKEERLQKTPVAVTAISRKGIEQGRDTSLADLRREVPAMAGGQSPSSGALMSSMRGLGYSDYQVSGDYPVGSYINGVYVPNGFSTIANYSDIDRVEVMRGPQGTLYGRNSTAGAVNIIMRGPQDDAGGSIAHTFGSDGLNVSTVKLDTGRYNGLAARIALTDYKSDGYIENPGENRNWDSQDNFYGSAAVDYKADNGVYAKYTYLSGENYNYQLPFQLLDTSGARMKMLGIGLPAGVVDGYILPGAEAAASSHNLHYIDTPTDDLIQDNDYYAHILEASAPINDNMKLKSITGYRQQDIQNSSDYTKANIVIPGIGPFIEAANGNGDGGYYHSTFFSQELQLVGNSAGGTVDYLGGIYFSKNDAGEKGDVWTLSPSLSILHYDNDYSAETSAVFGSVEWRPEWDWAQNKLHLTGGLRYSTESKEVKKHTLGTIFNGGTEGRAKNEDNFYDVSPTFIVGWDFSDSLFGYAKLSQAFKSGGYDAGNGQTSPLYNSPYDDEKATTYEIGMKNDISKNVRLNVAAYYTAFDDMQIVVVPSPMNPVERSTVNAGQVDIYGLEVDAEARITDELTVTGGYAYTAYQINKVTDEYGVLGAAPGGDVADDFTMAYVPENKLFVAARYEFNKTRYGRLAINASYAYQSSVDGYYWKNQPISMMSQSSVPGYGTMNANIELTEIPTGGDTSGVVRLWATNLLNEEYIDTINQSQLGPTGHFGEERVIGLDLVYKF